MLSGTFHVQAQEWRYFSREKSIVHTLHLSQLATGTPGEWVTIAVVPPSGSGNNGFTVPPYNLPTITPYNGLTMSNSVNNLKPSWMANDFVTPSLQSGTYGSWSGMVASNFNVVHPLQNEAEWVWPAATGGVFLVYAEWEHSSSDLLLPTQNRIVKTTDYGLGATTSANYVADVSDVQQENQEVVVLGGAGWNNQMYIGVPPSSMDLRVSTIFSIVPAHTWIGTYHDVATPYSNVASAGNGSILVFRLGP